MSNVHRQHPEDETGLITAAQNGDRVAFARLVDRYWDPLYRWLIRMTRESATAEDLTQETMLKAFNALDRFTAGTNFRAWLFRIAHNNFVNFRRTQKKQRSALPDEILDAIREPLNEMVSQEMLKLIAEAIAKLPSDFRGPFQLRIEEDLSFKEIAEVLEITEETARWRVFKARQKLMSTLAPALQTPTVDEPK